MAGIITSENIRGPFVLSKCQAALLRRPLPASGQVLCATLQTEGRQKRMKKNIYKGSIRYHGIQDEKRKKGGIKKTIE